MNHDDIEWLEHLKVLRLEPGDKLMVTFPNDLTMDVARTVTRQIESWIPGHDVIVICGGPEVGVIREDVPGRRLSPVCQIPACGCIGEEHA